jgi:hypothetical protein
MAVITKKKKKLQQLQEQQQSEYLTSRQVDLILKRGKDKLKHAITVSDEKLTKTKKQIVKEMAQDLEKAKYPVDQIFDKLSKYLKGLVHESTIRDALDTKYKNPEQSAVAKQQIHEGEEDPRQQEQVKKKDVKDITLEDIKLLDKAKARQVAKYQISKALWWEQQAKQWEDKAKELTKEIEDLKKQIKAYESKK